MSHARCNDSAGRGGSGGTEARGTPARPRRHRARPGGAGFRLGNRHRRRREIYAEAPARWRAPAQLMSGDNLARAKETVLAGLQLDEDPSALPAGHPAPRTPRPGGPCPG